MLRRFLLWLLRDDITEIANSEHKPHLHVTYNPYAKVMVETEDGIDFEWEPIITEAHVVHHGQMLRLALFSDLTK